MQFPSTRKCSTQKQKVPEKKTTVSENSTENE